MGESHTYHTYVDTYTHPHTQPHSTQGNRPALFLVPVTMAGYVLTLLAKEIVAVDTIEVLQVRYLGCGVRCRWDGDVVVKNTWMGCKASLVGGS